MSGYSGYDSGVSNVEIDWLLRGKLPENHAPLSLTQSNEQAHDTLQHRPEHHTAAPVKPSHVLTHTESTVDLNGNAGSHVLARSKSYSQVESTSSKKKGFFKSLFGKKSKPKEPSPEPNRVLRRTTTESRSPSPEANHKTLQRSRSYTYGNIDPKLQEFLDYYKAQGFERLHKDLGNEDVPKPSSRRPSTAKSTASVKTDVLGRPIPPHPDVAPLPPCIIKKPTFEAETEQTANPIQQAAAPSKFGFLRRHHSSVSETSREGSISSMDPLQDIPEESRQKVQIPGLDDLPGLKRVAFDVPVFFNDPPQQIPSRTPRKGEVEILKDGSIVIHRLSAAEKKQIMTSSGGGLIVGGSGHLKILTEEEKKEEGLESSSATNGDDEAKNRAMQDDAQKNEDLQETHKHSMGAAAAAAAAEARAKATPNELSRTVTNNEDEVQVSTGASKISIDKPMIRHNNKSSTSIKTLGQDQEQHELYPPKNVKVPLDTLYTRCCHLREILPIPATLKQLKPGSTDAIPLLQLRNPKPSLVEVLTFSDFISVAPILCLSLDGVSLSEDMLRIILSAVAHKKELEKLTLRNTPLDDFGWKLLCWFLTKAKGLSQLDLTQCPSIEINVQKPSKTSSNIPRMECNLENRSDRNWNLLNAALVSRGGIDELVINGAHINEQEFNDLIEMGISMKTSRLGLAYNGLTKTQCQVLAKNLNLNNLIGLDIGYNDLNGQLEPFIDDIANNERLNKDSKLKFLSLNSTNLQNTNHEVENLLSSFTNFRQLMYLDLSNNKKLFPGIMLALTQNLPLYPKLARFHLDYNDLTQADLVAVAEIIPFCKNLSYLSLVGNHIDAVSATSLTSALKISKSILTLDIDYDDISPKFRETIGLYTVRNMQQQLYKNDGTNIEGIQEELSKLLLSEDNNPDPKLVESFLEKAVNLRNRIRENIDSLFKLRLQGKLSTEGKETLIKFCFIDASIEKGLALLQQKPTLHCLHLLDKIENDKKSLPGSLLMSRNPSSSHVSSYVEEKGHSELLPFGVSDQTRYDHQDEHLAKELKDDQQARAADAQHIQEEASALKLSSKIKYRRDLSQRDVQALQNISGDEIRDLMSNTDDLNNVTALLDSMKEKGVTLANLYEKDSSSPDKASGLLKTQAELEAAQNTSKNLENGQRIIRDDSSEDSDDMSQAYDEILDHLEKVRTNSES